MVSESARYTLIAAMDAQGFIPSTLDIVHRDEISDEGAAGTVDATYFEEWVEKRLGAGLSWADMIMAW